MGVKIGDTALTQFPFRAIAYYLKVMDEPKYCWADGAGAVIRYSDAYVERLRLRAIPIKSLLITSSLSLRQA
jgi:hypothetical protein